METSKKYVFTGETQQYNGRTLRRIKRISDGLIGGWIESEANLSHYGTCFVYNNAKVYDNARLSENVKVCGDAQIFGNAWVGRNAQVSKNARVYDNARVSENALVYGTAQVYGNARIFGNARVNKRVVNITGLRHIITITDNYIMIKCEAHSINHWKKNIVKIGQDIRYSNEEIQQVINIFKALNLKELT